MKVLYFVLFVMSYKLNIFGFETVGQVKQVFYNNNTLRMLI